MHVGNADRKMYVQTIPDEWGLIFNLIVKPNVALR